MNWRRRMDKEMPNPNITAVIMAGGRGTRLASMYSDIPKPMVPVCGKPILEHQIECLRRQGIRRVILSVGHLSQIIEDYFEDGGKRSPVTGEPFGVCIEYVREHEPLGTAGALYYMKNMIREDFILLNGDLIFDIDLSRFYHFHKTAGTSATIFVHPNDHPFDSGIVVTDEKNLVVRWLHKEEERGWCQNRVNAGLHFLSQKILESFPAPEKRDLDRDILRPLIAGEQLSAYYATEYVKDVGTPDRLGEVEADMISGKVAGKNLSLSQKAVFLDRDGVVNRYKGFLRDIEDFQLLEGVSEAVKAIHRAGYLAIVVTNQPVIARGEVTWEELNEIHCKMETLLGAEGAYVDDIYICPHHPDSGFAGERKEYKMDCACRKPKPGMLLKAAEDYNIDLLNSWMVGDSESDMQAGLAAGCQTALISAVASTRWRTYPDLTSFADTIWPKK